MRGRQEPQVTMLAFVDLEERVPADHPLRAIKALADEALTRLSPEFDRMYADVGRPSIPPERLLKASLLIALFSVRSERAFCAGRSTVADREPCIRCGCEPTRATLAVGHRRADEAEGGYPVGLPKCFIPEGSEQNTGNLATLFDGGDSRGAMPDVPSGQFEILRAGERDLTLFPFSHLKGKERRVRRDAFLDCVHCRLERFGTRGVTLKSQELEPNAFDQTIVNAPAELLSGQQFVPWVHVRLEESAFPQVAQINLRLMAMAHAGAEQEAFQVYPAHQLAPLCRNSLHSSISMRRWSRRSERK